MSGRGRLLVRLPNWLGDAMMARPLLHALRQRWPADRVIALGPAALLELLGPEGCWAHAEAWPPDAAARRRLRGPAPGVALILPPSFSSAWFAWRLGVARRVGFRGDRRSWLLTDAVARGPRGDLHLSEEYASLGARLDVRVSGVPDPLPVAAADRDRAAGLAGARAVILAPGAAYGPTKRWDAERFAAAGRHFRDRGHRVLVCGAAADREVAARVSEAIGKGAACLAGETTLGVQAALCAAAAVVLSNDSGLAHLAAATGAPTVVVFGSTSSAWTAPVGARVRVVQHAPVCSPCFRRDCRIGRLCLAAVSVAEVVRAAEGMAA